MEKEIIRAATIEDVDVLVNHHIAMFKEIFELESVPVDNDSFDKMEASYRLKLSEQIPSGMCKVWMVINNCENQKPIASAALSILNAVATPFDCSCKKGYIHSVFTEKKWRKQGWANRLVKIAIEYAAENGINRIDLTASNEGRKIYEQLGFKETKLMTYFKTNDKL